MQKRLATILITSTWILSAPALAGELYGPYRAALVRVIDGDTVELDLAIYPGLSSRVRIREDGINTPEKRTSSPCEKVAGLAATAFTEVFLTDRELIVAGVREGKYAGRLLGHIYAGAEPLGLALQAEGLARPYDGGKRAPWCIDEEAD